ncbi:MAG: hypothetical protein GY950_08900, partial [bacterium]|nr:hypothetical protein [bacterium]
MKNFKKLFFMSAILFVFFFLMGGKKIMQDHRETQKEYRYFALFSEVVSLVKTNYVEFVNAADKFPGAYSAMLNSLDPYSAYLDAGKTENYRAYQNGRFYGCGIFGIRALNYFYITRVVPGSPAEKTGLKPRDMIKAVNGESLYLKSYWEMVLALMSTRPQKIELLLFEKNRRDTKKIIVPTIAMNACTSLETLQNGILHVKLSRFDATAADLLEQRLISGTSGARTEPLKLIIDLRSYCGGDFQSFKKICNLFFKESLLLTLKYKNKEEDFILGARTAAAYKAAVIVDRSTRMYGELLAAMFKNTGAPSQRPVTLIGSQSPGFVSKLKSIPLDDGSSILITEGLFLLEGKPAASGGVTPDIIEKDYAAGELVKKCISILTPRPNKPGTPAIKKNEK